MKSMMSIKLVNYGVEQRRKVCNSRSKRSEEIRSFIYGWKWRYRSLSCSHLYWNFDPPIFEIEWVPIIFLWGKGKQILGMFRFWVKWKWPFYYHSNTLFPAASQFHNFLFDGRVEPHFASNVGNELMGHVALKWLHFCPLCHDFRFLLLAFSSSREKVNLDFVVRKENILGVWLLAGNAVT